MTVFRQAVVDVFAEKERAEAKWGTGSYASPHEGISVIREEFEELWEHVRANTGRSPEARKEAIQLAYTVLRYAAELTR